MFSPLKTKGKGKRKHAKLLYCSFFSFILYLLFSQYHFYVLSHKMAALSSAKSYTSEIRPPAQSRFQSAFKYHSNLSSFTYQISIQEQPILSGFHRWNHPSLLAYSTRVNKHPALETKL